MDNWIAVQIAAGLFPSERIVHFKTVEGDVSFFVCSDHIDEGRKRLKVTLLDKDDNFALVQFPSQEGLKFAKVSRAELVSTPR